MESTETVRCVTAADATARTEDNNELEYWIYTGFSVPLALGALYLSVTQITFCIKTLKVRFTQRRYSNDNVLEKYGTILNVISGLATTSAFLRAGIDFRLIFGRYNDLGCDLAVTFKLANYALSLIGIYFVLWLRQRVFYQHPGLQHLSSKLIRFVSWAMSFVIFVGMLGTTSVFFALGVYVGTPKGCAVPKGPLTVVRWFVMIGCTTLFQICLLALFIYPLVRHKSSDATTENNREDVIIYPLVKRATVTAISCVLSDVGFAFLVIGMKRETTTLTTFLYDVNIVFNAFCMVMSFGNWKIRLMPWKTEARTQIATNSSLLSHDCPTKHAIERRTRFVNSVA